MRDAGLGVHLDQIEDHHTGGLTTGAGGGRNGDQRLEAAGHGLTSTDRRVHVIEKFRRMRRVQIRGFAGVDDRAAAERNITIWLVFSCESDRIRERRIQRQWRHQPWRG